MPPLPSAQPAAVPAAVPARRRTFPALLLLVVLPGYALDQLTKGYILRHLDLYDVRPVIPAFFFLTHLTNTGSAFGMFSNSNGLFVAVSVLALIVLGVLYRRGAFEPGWPLAGFALLLPGVLGNLTDRLLHGHVVDFLLFDLHVPGAHPWPAFNVADSCICVAVGCFLFGSWQDYRKAEGRR